MYMRIAKFMILKSVPPYQGTQSMRVYTNNAELDAQSEGAYPNRLRKKYLCE